MRATIKRTMYLTETVMVSLVIFVYFWVYFSKAMAVLNNALRNSHYTLDSTKGVHKIGLYKRFVVLNKGEANVPTISHIVFFFNFKLKKCV